MKYVSCFCFCLTLMLAGTLAAGDLGIGSTVPDFTLKDVAGNSVDYSGISGDGTVVTFIATKCPISNDYNGRMKALYSDYNGKGVKFVFINSNVRELAPEVKEHTQSNGFQFQVYKDPGNVVADLFGAQFTPEAYLMKSGSVIYHGRIDDSRSGEIKDHSLSDALDAVLAGKSPARQETKAFGCTIKRVKSS